MKTPTRFGYRGLNEAETVWLRKFDQAMAGKASKKVYKELGFTAGQRRECYRRRYHARQDITSKFTQFQTLGEQLGDVTKSDLTHHPHQIPTLENMKDAAKLNKGRGKRG